MPTLTCRRRAFGLEPLTVGSLIECRSGGKDILQVTKIAVIRRAGDPAGRDILRLSVDRIARSDGAGTVRPYPGVKRPPRAAPPHRPVGIAPHPAALEPRIVVAKSRKQRKRDKSHKQQVAADDGGPVPHEQRVSGKAVRGVWRDPEDNVHNRAPRMARGWRRYDPIECLAKINPAVTVEHVVASDCYRLACELGPGRGLVGGRDLAYRDKSFTGSQGPSDALCDRMAAWRHIQAQFLPRERQMLQVIVLDRMSATNWANLQGGGGRYMWVGFIVNVLERLLSIYRDDVDSFLRQEHVPLD